MRRNEPLNAVTSELDEADIKYEVWQGKRNTHYKVRFQFNGQSKTVFLPSSTRNWNAVDDARAKVRRILRQH